MSKWDVIIVGAGYGGLCSGALLAQKGKRVLVLEKDHDIGGRAKSILYEGHVLDDGAHIPSQSGHLESIFSDLDIPYPEILPLPDSEIYIDGKWQSSRSLFSQDMFREVLGNIMKLSSDEISSLNDVPLNDWVAGISNDPGIRLLFFYLGCSTSVGNRFETYSAGEMIYVLRDILDTGRKLRDIAGVIKGGMLSILKPLRNCIEKNGGEVRLNSPVESVEIKNGKVIGVNIETGDRLFHSQVMPVETLKSDHVIITVPMWDIFSVLDESQFPNWWVDWVKWIGAKISQAWSIIYALDEPLFDLGTFRLAPNLPESGFSGIFFPMPGYGGKSGEYQFHVSYQGHYDEMPDLLNRKSAKVRREIRDTIAMLERESIQLYPKLKDANHWRIAHAGIYGIAQSPGFVGQKRPSMKVPGFPNLFIVSGTSQEARGISMSAIGKCARMAADAIMSGE
ncbi:MAG: NAD(P)/FAD-dependent oxidoreductase [Desulfobacterales bacterium]